MFLKEKFDIVRAIKKFRVLVLVGAILALAIGVLFVISPLYTAGYLIWIMIVLFGVSGLISIFKFIFPGKGNERNGLMLVFGIIVVLLAVGIIVAGISASNMPVNVIDIRTREVIETTDGGTLMTLRMLTFLSVFFGIFEIVDSIFVLCNCGRIESEQRGWVIAKSIFGFIIGILLVIFPWFTLYVACFINGIYLIIMGITVMVLDIKFWKVTDKEIEDVKAEAKDVIDNE